MRHTALHITYLMNSDAVIEGDAVLSFNHALQNYITKGQLRWVSAPGDSHPHWHVKARAVALIRLLAMAHYDTVHIYNDEYAYEERLKRAEQSKAEDNARFQQDIKRKRQYPPPPPRPRAAPAGSNAYSVLKVVQNAPLAVCEAAYRALTRLYHPDAGGDTASMQAINAAIAAIRKEQQ